MVLPSASVWVVWVVTFALKGAPVTVLPPMPASKPTKPIPTLSGHRTGADPLVENVVDRRRGRRSLRLSARGQRDGDECQREDRYACRSAVDSERAEVHFRSSITLLLAFLLSMAANDSIKIPGWS